MRRKCCAERSVACKLARHRRVVLVRKDARTHALHAIAASRLGKVMRLNDTRPRLDDAEQCGAAGGAVRLDALRRHARAGCQLGALGRRQHGGGRLIGATL